MITLGLSSSTALVGVAIARDDDVLAEKSILTDRRHAEEITPMLQSVLVDAAVDLSEIERIVVDVGPGRYTGMRVGIASAKTLAFALGVPVAPITSLELIGAAAPAHDGPRFAVVDARRNQVFAIELGSTGSPLVVSPTELIEQLPPNSLLVGDGADRYQAEFESVASVSVGVVPSVAAAALLDRMIVGGPAAEISPLYLREPDAAINIKTRPGGTGAKQK